MDLDVAQVVLPEHNLNGDFYRAVLDSLDDQFAVINQHGRIVFVNKSWRLFAQANGLPYDFAWIGYDYLAVCQSAVQSGEGSVEQVSVGLRAVLSGASEQFYFEYPCHSPNEQRWFILRVVPVDYAGSNCFAVSHQNITQRKLIEQAVEHAAQHDPLTGLANRRRFEAFVHKSWKRAQKALQPLSVLIVDLDHFKALNDSLGHLEGDRALVRIATALQGCARRESDLAARFGGDEFVLVLRDTDAEGAALVARDVVSKVAALQVIAANGVRVGASVGVVTRVPGFSDDCQEPSALLPLADRALYQVKGAGGNGFRHA